MSIHGINSLNPNLANDYASNTAFGTNQKQETQNKGILEKSIDLVREVQDKGQEQLSFLEQLKNKENIKPKPDLKSMENRLADIQRKGLLLRHHPLPDIAEEYVDSIKGFLKDVRDHAYQSNSKDNIFQKVDVVDKKLDSLAEKLINEQKPEIDLVASLGELEGLLIDIFV